MAHFKHGRLIADNGHLTPNLLKKELADFRRLKGYLPRILLVHLNPYLEKEIESEIAVLSKDFYGSITLATEGMQLKL